MLHIVIHGFRRGSRSSRHSFPPDRPAAQPTSKGLPGGFDVLNASMLHDLRGYLPWGHSMYDAVPECRNPDTGTARWQRDSKGHEETHTPGIKYVLRPESVQPTEYLSRTGLLRINQPSVLAHWPQWPRGCRSGRWGREEGLSLGLCERRATDPHYY